MVGKFLSVLHLLGIEKYLSSVVSSVLLQVAGCSFKNSVVFPLEVYGEDFNCSSSYHLIVLIIAEFAGKSYYVWSSLFKFLVAEVRSIVIRALVDLSENLKKWLLDLGLLFLGIHICAVVLHIA